MSEERKQKGTAPDPILDNLRSVGGGEYLPPEIFEEKPVNYNVSLVNELLARIKANGKASQYKEILKAKGKAAAVAACCIDNPDLCGYCSIAVTLL